MSRRIWSHEEIKAAADGDFKRFARLNRREALLGGAAAAAGAFMMPFIPGAARAEIGGDLNTLTWEGYDNIEPTKEWAAQHNVKITNASMATQDDVQAKLVGGSAVRLDVTSYNQAYNHFYADELKIIQPLDMTKVPTYNENDIFAPFYQKDRWYWAGTQWGIPFCWGLVALVYNPKMMARPTSYKDLLAPELKGKITIVDDMTGTWPALAKVAGVDTFPDVTKDDLAKIFEHAKLYKDQCKTFSLSNGDVVSLMVSGDVAACLCVGTNITVDAAKQGLELEYVIPEEGAFMWSDALCLPNSASNIDTAYAFMNECIGPKAQAWQAARCVCGTVNKNAIELMDEETRSLFDYSDLDTVLKNTPLLGIPPRESDDLATYDEWVQAYEGLKSGI